MLKATAGVEPSVQSPFRRQPILQPGYKELI